MCKDANRTNGATGRMVSGALQVVLGARRGFSGARRGFSGALLGGILLLTAGAGCSPTVTDVDGIRLVVRTPDGEENPFGLAEAAFVAITAEGPGVAEQYIVKVYDPGMKIELPGIPFGQQRQVRVEVWGADEFGKPSQPLGMGRTMPVNVVSGQSPVLLDAYVTRVNRFAPIYDNGGGLATSDSRVGATSVVLPDGKVLQLGGGTLAAGKSPYDPANYKTMINSIMQYDPEARTTSYLGDEYEAAVLDRGRVFHATAVGANGLVAIAGGYVKEGTKNVVTNSVEFYDPVLKAVRRSEAGTPDLVFARAGATITQMYAGQNYFLIAGGTGPVSCGDDGQTPCAANTWEIWHPDGGLAAYGRLNEPRWNHAAVRVPGQDGGYLLLIGGENDSGALANFEVVQFAGSYVSQSGQKECPTPGGATCPDNFLWEPQTRPMPVARTFPGAAFVSYPGPAQCDKPICAHHYVYIVGGFADKQRSSAVARVDVFDIGNGVYVEEANGFAMLQARGAPMVAAVAKGPRAGQVLIAGGSSNDTTNHASAEFIYFPDPTSPEGLPQLVPVYNDLVGGKRTMGTATSLPTGHVLLSGGTSGSADQLDMMVWNPL